MLALSSDPSSLLLRMCVDSLCTVCGVIVWTTDNTSPMSHRRACLKLKLCVLTGTRVASIRLVKHLSNSNCSSLCLSVRFPRACVCPMFLGLLLTCFLRVLFQSSVCLSRCPCRCLCCVVSSHRVPVSVPFGLLHVSSCAAEDRGDKSRCHCLQAVRMPSTLVVK